MKERKKRIGFLSYWGLARGLSYSTLCYVKMLQEKYDIYIFKQLDNEINSEFKDVNVNITEHQEYEVHPKTFKKWLISNKIDAVIFNEYDQWKDSGTKLPELTRDLGIKAYGYLVMEKFTKEQTKRYDRVLARTVTMERFLRQHKCRNFSYTPYSIDLNEFPMCEHKNAKTDEQGMKWCNDCKTFIEAIVEPVNEKFTYFHPGGFGGVYERKNTRALLEAFVMMDDPNTKLIITSQREIDVNSVPKCKGEIEIINKNLDRKDFLQYYKDVDVVVLPSKWETIGLPILESLASGTPVITCDVPPMNEFVRPGLNGYLTKCEMEKYNDISVYAAIVDPADLRNRMESIRNPIILELLKKNSRHVVETIYDLEKNKKYFLDFLEKEFENR